MSSTVEGLLDAMGGFGRAQVIVTVFYVCVFISVEWSMILIAFAAIVPDWHCVIELTDRNTTDGSIHDNTTSTNHFSEYKVCSINGTKCHSYVFDQWPRTMINEWGLVCDLQWVKATVMSLQMAGVMAGSILAGYLGDRYGRRNTNGGFMLFSFVANIVTAFSVSWEMFAAGRFFIGLGLGGLVVVLYSYCVEFIPTKSRSMFILLPGYFIGFNLLGLSCHFLQDFTYLHLLTGASTLPGLLGYFAVPESIRWLAVKNRLDEAMHSCSRVAAYNRTQVPKNARDVLETVAQDGIKSRGTRQYTYLDLVRDRYLLKVTVIVCYHWAAMNLIYYGISFAVSSFSGNFSLNVLYFTLADTPFVVIVYFLISRLGRKICVMGIFSICSAAALGCVVAELTAPEERKGLIVNLMAIIARIAASTGYMVVAIWGVELYPTVTRNLGYGAHSATARIGGMLAPFVVDMEKHTVLAFVIICVMSLVVTLSCLALPETKATALPDTLNQTKGLYSDNTQVTVQEAPSPDSVPLKSVGENGNHKQSDELQC